MLRQCIHFALLLLAATAKSQYIGGILQTPSGMGSASDIRGSEIVGDSLSGLGGAPCIWQGENNKFSQLPIDKFDFGQVFGAGGGKQVGYGSIDDQWRATMWSGPNGTLVDLHPSGFLGSVAYGTDGSQQVGAGGVDPNLPTSHALVWEGSAKSSVDLHPGGSYQWSEAYAVEGGVQVGVAENVPVIWHGTAGSMELLPMPAGFTLGSVGGIAGSQVAGRISGFSAVVWDISQGTFEPLGEGVAVDTNGVHQVGIIGPIGKTRAIRWSGTMGTNLDLHQFLPSQISESRATGIDDDGRIVGVGHINGVGDVPVIWTPVPEPATGYMLLASISALIMRIRVGMRYPKDCSGSPRSYLEY
jgi:hypothetical protein